MEHKNNAIKIFCCYAREDEYLLKELKTNLIPLQRQELITVWHDRDISAGTEWEQEIKQHLDEANIILLLISANFLQSDYCYGVEMARALQRHEHKEATVIPIILRPVFAWQHITIGNTQLGRLQALPKDTKPLTQWNNRDEAWHNVAEGIRRVAAELLRLPSTDQSTFILDPITNAPRQQEVLPYITSHARMNWWSIIPFIRNAVIRFSHKQSLPIGYITLLLLLVALLISGGGYFYLFVYNTRSTATEFAQQNATATVQASPNTYDDYVTKYGIMLGFDPQHTHTNPYEHYLSVANVSGLRQIWTASTGARQYISLTVANNIVYGGSWDNNLHALNAVTGQQKWVAPTNSYIESCPAVARGIVYVSSEDNNLYAFNATTGQQKWVAPTADWTNSSPTVVNGIVYVGSSDGKLYAFDALTGRQRWAVFAGNSIDYSSPAVANGVVYIGSLDGKLSAFDATTGQQKWVAPTGDRIESSPAVAYGVVYVGSSDGNLYALDATTGQQKWVTPTTGGSPAVANGVVYVGSSDHWFYAFDAVTGQRIWRASTGGYIDESSPVVANGVVYIGSSDEKTYAFSL